MSSSSASSVVVFDDFVTASVNLPDYESERWTTTVWLVLSSIFWFVVAPPLLLLLLNIKKTRNNNHGNNGDNNNDNDNQQQASTKVETTTIISSNDNNSGGGGRMRKVIKRKTIMKQKTKTRYDGEKSTSSSSSTNNRTLHEPESKEVVVEERNSVVVSISATILSCVGWMVTVILVLLRVNPHNYYTSRRVFQAPLLTRAECFTVMQMAEQAAERNIVQNLLPSDERDERNNSTSLLLEEPIGWQKSRHGSYPTTDLNLVTDPFLPTDRKYIGELLDKRLAPLLQRIFGITSSLSIRANDCFIVRYDSANNGRTFLSNHTDDSDISFNVLLNNDFEGGGTRFWNRLDAAPFAHVQPTEPGTVLTHSALIHHEGVHITNGSRWILVGFLSVDKVQPFTGYDTELSIYASWLSLPWMHRRFKDSYELSMNRRLSSQRNNRQQPKNVNNGEKKKWTDNMYVRMLFVDLVNILNHLGDVFGIHEVVTVVDSDRKTDFLQALDDNFDSHSKENKASWWKGQQLNIDIDGSVGSEWSTRAAHKESFQEL